MSRGPTKPVTPQLSLLRRRQPSAARGSRAALGREHSSRQVLDEALFRDALNREQRRADRFEEAFILVLISMDGRGASSSRWSQVLEALVSTRRDTDIIGWLEDGAVVGLIRPHVESDAPAAAAALSATVQREVSRCLTAETAASCSIRLDVFSAADDARPPAVGEGSTSRVWRDRAKRVLDIVGSGALLTAFSPLLLLIAGLVKLTSKGPVLFQQQRIGEGGRPFKMLKFRTMQVNNDDTIHQQYVAQYIESSAAQAKAAEGKPVFKIVDDPRITSIGHFLRRASLDELPQFWNVLRGDMSLVGPRPPLPYEVARYKRWHRRRVLEAKPGITGLWQVTGRSTTTFDEMVRLDLRYAKGYSVWTDVKILLRTPKAVITGKGAH